MREELHCSLWISRDGVNKANFGAKYYYNNRFLRRRIEIPSLHEWLNAIPYLLFDKETCSAHRTPKMVLFQIIRFCL